MEVHSLIYILIPGIRFWPVCSMSQITKIHATSHVQKILSGQQFSW